MNPQREFELEAGEELERSVRIHWFFFLGQLLPFAFLAILPLLIPLAIRLAGPDFALFASFTGFSTPLSQAALGAWWLLIWSAAFNTFTRYFLNVWILTNERIVDVDQKGFFNREVSSLFLDRVQDVTVDTRGVMQSLLHIGDINVQTAGTEERFTMKNVPRPEELRDAIMRLASATPPKPE